MHTTNYRNAFIAVSPDTKAVGAIVPDKPGSVAGRQYAMIAGAPHRLTSDDVIFTIHADRAGLAEAERPAARAAYFSKGQACQRSSPLVKSFGWGVHHDGEGRVALAALGSADYAKYASDPALEQTVGMRSKRA
ncbi:MAG: hypothetical protein IPL47_14065 [Phyllobacteriaceae bacterium]|nr:hypothetical protein [Phyllobacteriaceae bacterium]